MDGYRVVVRKYTTREIVMVDERAYETYDAAMDVVVKYAERYEARDGYESAPSADFLRRNVWRRGLLVTKHDGDPSSSLVVNVETL